MHRRQDGPASLFGRYGECATLDGLVAGARAGRSQVLVVRGEAGIGKTALLDYLETNATGCRVARSAGAEAEMELAYAGLHQICAPFLDRLGRLPEPQRVALSAAFGLVGGDAPDRFMVGLAVLDLLADRAEERPLICLIEQGFARRLSTLPQDTQRLLVAAAAEPLGDATLLWRAARLTPDPARRADRELAAAWHKRGAGALDAALALLATIEAGPSDQLRAAKVKHLRGQIALDQRRATDAVRLLLDAAQRLEPLDGDLARETYLEALGAAILSSTADGAASAVAVAAQAAAPAEGEPRITDLILDALATRLLDGHAAAVPALARALAKLRSVDDRVDDTGRLPWLGGNPFTGYLATELWDFDAGRALAELQVQRARDAGALVQLQLAANVLALNEMLAGRLTDAAALVEEDRMVADVTGNPPVGYAATLLAALRASDTAPQLIAAARDDALALGGEGADASFRESIEHLDRAGLRLEAARGHLLHGEWLRRAGERNKAREQLRAAHDMLLAMGVAAFAERARRELVVLGEKGLQQSVRTTEELTAQEFHIARFARDGLSNAEIGARLFISPRTVEWHLGKVFSKLGISSRRQLRTAALDVEPG